MPSEPGKKQDQNDGGDQIHHKKPPAIEIRPFDRIQKVEMIDHDRQRIPAEEQQGACDGITIRKNQARCHYECNGRTQSKYCFIR